MPRISAIISAKGRLSTNFAIVVSFDVKEVAVSATLPRPDTGLGAHLRRLGKAERVEPRKVFGGVPVPNPFLPRGKRLLIPVRTQHLPLQRRVI
jgi:hypothetical protein